VTTRDRAADAHRSVQLQPAAPVELRYGAERVRAPLGRAALLGVLRPAPMEALDDPAAAVQQALEDPIASTPLADLARGARTAVILVSGRDRVTRADAFMPPLLRTLSRAGVRADRITVIVATGTHVPFARADLARIAGPSLDPRIGVVGHDCMDSAGLVLLGETSFGNQVRLNRLAHAADVKILTGRITHHYFAGFTGGRKAVLPGIAGFDTITRNHALVMTGNGRRAVHAAAENGRLDGNPVHLDMLEGARLFAPTFTINTVVDAQHRVTGVVAGEMAAAHHAGCRVVDEHFRVRVSRPAELVLASCGGDPYDVSFMQALKAIFNSHAAVADGGALLLLAACPEGIKDGFLRWTAVPGLADLAAAVRARYDLTGHNSYLLREVLQRIRVVLVSRCAAQDVQQLGLIPASRLEHGWQLALRAIGTERPSTWVIPHGNITVSTPPHDAR
jgi:lactate racemase